MGHMLKMVNVVALFSFTVFLSESEADIIVSGTVKATNGSNIVGARVEFNKVSTSEIFYSITDQNGRYEIHLLPQATAVIEDDIGESQPQEIFLAQNYPNPFNPSTILSYSIPEETEVELSIYNILGQKIRTLVHSEQLSGYYNVVWDGKNDNGEGITAGVYIYLLKAGKEVLSRKMLLLDGVPGYEHSTHRLDGVPSYEYVTSKKNIRSKAMSPGLYTIHVWGRNIIERVIENVEIRESTTIDILDVQLLGPEGMALINVKAYGAAGDGMTDDTYAIQAAINDGSLSGRPVYIPAGTYVTSSPLQVNSFQTILGDGQYMSIIQNITTDGMKKKTDLSTVSRVTLQGLQFQTANDGVNDKVGIDATAFTYSKFNDIHVRFYRTGILLSRGPSSEPCFFNSFRDITIFGCKDGMKIDDSSGYSVNTCSFDNLIIEDVGVWSGGNGIVLSGYGHIFTGVYVGLPGGNAAVKFLPTYGYSATGSCVLIRLYGESSMTYLVDLGAGTSGNKNTLIAPHVDSLTMLLTSNPNDPDLIIIP